MNATVDIDTTVGGEKKGKVIEYQEIRGYILAQKPKMLRMIGLLPIVRSRAFDMVSDGDQLRVVDSAQEPLYYRQQPAHQDQQQPAGESAPAGDLRSPADAGDRRDR